MLEQTDETAEGSSPSPADGGRGWRGRAAWGGALAVAAVVLSWCYILQALTQSANSDGAGMALQGWDMLHGNILLRGWWTADVSFSTFEIPLDALVIAVRGLSADVVHVTAGILYALLVLAAALLARGRARGRAGVGRALLAAGIMIAPGLGEGTRVLLGSPDHVGVGVLILLTLLVIDRGREHWLVPVAVCVLLVWAQLDDPLAEFAAALPVAVVCLVRSGVSLGRHVSRRDGSWTRGAWRYEAGLVVAAVVSYELTRIAVHAIRAAGGLSMQSLSTATTSVPASQWGVQLLHTGQDALLLFGADYFWQSGAMATAIACLHLVGAALAVAGLTAGIVTCVRGGDRVTQVLTVATLVTLGAAAFGSPIAPGYGAHEIAVVLPFGAVLAGRTVGPWLLRHASLRRESLKQGPLKQGSLRHGRLGLTRAGLTALLGAIAAAYLAVLGYSVSQPALPAQNQALAGFLAEHHLNSGIGKYWAANITTAVSDWHVRVIPAQSVPSHPYPWIARPSWYDPAQNYANFVVAGDPPDSATYPVQDVLSAFGRPAREYRFDGYVIMVYRRNLLRDMAPPIQPNPDTGSRF